MASVELNDNPIEGFSFENCRRNAFLGSKGFKPPKMTKTGTTICGVVFKDGVVLGADTRSTGGDIVADKNCEKIHKLAANIFCGGAGTAADCEKTTRMVSASLELHRLNTDRQTPVCVATTMLKQYLFRYQGYVGAYLILGGMDCTGPSICTVHAHGSSDNLPFTALGSGSLAAMAVLELRWKEDMEEEEAKKLVRDAIAAGIFNDMGSGSNVDLCIIKANDQVEYLRGYDIANEKGERLQSYEYPKGTTTVLQEETKPIIVEETQIREIPQEVPVAMET